MATNNSVNTPLSGTTGTGNFVGANTPTLITPNIGVATATSIVFSPTTSGIIGTTTNDNAAAGKVGEIIESTVLVGSAVSLSNATSADITSISLTAGDWDVWGIVTTNPNGATTQTNFNAWVNTTSATPPTLPNAGAYTVLNGIAVSAGGIFSVPTGMRRLSLSTTTTVYLSTNISFAVSTMAAYGYIGARRRR